VPAVLAQQSSEDAPTAELVFRESDADDQQPEQPRAEGDATETSPSQSPTVRRVGSPFAESFTETIAGLEDASITPTAQFEVRPARYPRVSAAGGGAIAALVLGLMSFVIGFFSVGAAVTALVGLMMGIWGLYSPRRGVALTGILLCCVAMAIAGFNGIVSLYEFQHGYKPWESPSQLEPLGDLTREDADF
jgi:hypothetical protein